MTAIAYISDAKLLEYHRLNQNHEFNFWRLSTESFRNFTTGDLLFFLSKDKAHLRNGEKGIVGCGSCAYQTSASLSTMWKRFGSLNGYLNKNAFVTAVSKATRKKVKPKKLSSIYLKDVVFFQSPLYLSDAGMQISRHVESYIYLDKAGSVTFNLLDNAKNDIDIWSSGQGAAAIIENNLVKNALFSANNLIALKPTNKASAAKKDLAAFMANHGYQIVRNSFFEAYKIIDNKLFIVFADLYLNKLSTYRLLISQAKLYRTIIGENYPYNLQIIFETTTQDKELEALLNSL